MPDSDPNRAWLFRLRQLARECPLPGPIRVNVGVTRRAATELQRSLRRDGVRVETIDCAGKPTHRIVLEGMTFEWLAGD
ncbi:MAG: hypothetical protein WDM94_09445 [Bauldia sp.]